MVWFRKLPLALSLGCLVTSLGQALSQALNRTWRCLFRLLWDLWLRTCHEVTWQTQTGLTKVTCVFISLARDQENGTSGPPRAPWLMARLALGALRWARGEPRWCSHTLDSSKWKEFLTKKTFNVPTENSQNTLEDSLRSSDPVWTSWQMRSETRGLPREAAAEGQGHWPDLGLGPQRSPPPWAVFPVQCYRIRCGAVHGFWLIVLNVHLTELNT